MRCRHGPGRPRQPSSRARTEGPQHLRPNGPVALDAGGRRLGEPRPAGREGALRRRVAEKGVPSTSASDPLWEELFPAEQARIVRLQVERVEVGPTGADIRLRVVGLASLIRDLGAIGPTTLRTAA